MNVLTKPISVVIPAEAGIHFSLQTGEQIKMDSRFRGNDGEKDICGEIR
jgi:hypothetical protein